MGLRSANRLTPRGLNNYIRRALNMEWRRDRESPSTRLRARHDNAVSCALGRDASAGRELAQATLAERGACPRAASHTSHDGRAFAVGTTCIP
eukprot:scaffold92075_cov63-Phaeocystis_antarctica.AAC.2